MASIERYWDGLAVGSGRSDGTTGAVYLFGYVAEMLLKAAFFRLRRFPAVHPVTGHLKLIKAAADRQAPGRFKQSDYHDIRMLCEGVVSERAALGTPLSPALASDLVTRANRIQGSWTTALRYSGAPLAEAAANDALRDAEWFLANYPAFY